MATQLNLNYVRFVRSVTTPIVANTQFVALMKSGFEMLKAAPWMESTQRKSELPVNDPLTFVASDVYDAYKASITTASSGKQSCSMGMAAYRFKIPAYAISNSVYVDAIKATVGADKFAYSGLKIAAIASNDATPPTDWTILRAGGFGATVDATGDFSSPDTTVAPNTFGYLASREALVSAATNKAEDLTLDLSALAANYTYLYLIVSMYDYTDYRASRQYWIEGSGIVMGESALVTFGSSVTADSADASDIATADTAVAWPLPQTSAIFGMANSTTTPKGFYLRLSNETFFQDVFRANSYWTSASSAGNYHNSMACAKSICDLVRFGTSAYATKMTLGVTASYDERPASAAWKYNGVLQQEMVLLSVAAGTDAIADTPFTNATTGFNMFKQKGLVCNFQAIDASTLTTPNRYWYKQVRHFMCPYTLFTSDKMKPGSRLIVANGSTVQDLTGVNVRLTAWHIPFGSGDYNYLFGTTLFCVGLGGLHQSGDFLNASADVVTETLNLYTTAYKKGDDTFTAYTFKAYKIGSVNLPSSISANQAFEYIVPDGIDNSAGGCIVLSPIATDVTQGITSGADNGIGLSKAFNYTSDAKAVGWLPKVSIV